MTADVPDLRTERALNLALAAVIGAAPLLPAGPAHFGWPAAAYVELTVPALAALWIAARLAARGLPRAPWPLPLLPWHVVAATAAGAAILGSMGENRVNSPVFLATLAGEVGDLFRPMNQASHPLYPVRVAWTFVGGWLVFLLVADICRRARDPRRRARAALAGWIGGLLLVSVFAVVQYATRFNLHPYWVKANPNIVRAHSTLDDPNALGAVLLLGIGLAAGVLRAGPARWRRSTLLLAAVGAAALLTTMSRAAIGGAVIACLGVLAFTPRPETWLHRVMRVAGRATLAALAVVLLGSAMFRLATPAASRTLPGSEAQLVLKTLDPRESADWVLRGRLAWWRAGVRMFLDRPMEGVGLGRYPRLMGEYGGGPWRENTHNLFLQMFAETGLPGGIAFMGFIGSLCVVFALRVRSARDPQVAGIALGALIALAGFGLTLVTGHTLLLASGQILFASFLAPVAGLTIWRGAAEPGAVPSSIPRASRSFAGLLLIGAMLAYHPLAGALGGVSPRAGAWGYSWGLYGLEDPGATAYQWTGSRALLDLDVPGGTSAVDLPVAAPHPVRSGRPVHVRVTSGGFTHDAVLWAAEVVMIRIPHDVSSAAGRMHIRIEVEPTFVPARVDSRSTDTRELGVQLFQPQVVRDEHDPRQ